MIENLAWVVLSGTLLFLVGVRSVIEKRRANASANVRTSSITNTDLGTASAGEPFGAREDLGMEEEPDQSPPRASLH